MPCKLIIGDIFSARAWRKSFGDFCSMRWSSAGEKEKKTVSVTIFEERDGNRLTNSSVLNKHGQDPPLF